MKKLYEIHLKLTLVLDDCSDHEIAPAHFPDSIPEETISALIDNLNISHETNDMFWDSLQEYIEPEVAHYNFELENKDG